MIDPTKIQPTVHGTWIRSLSQALRELYTFTTGGTSIDVQLPIQGYPYVIDEETVAAGGADYVEFTWTAAQYKGLSVEFNLLPETDGVDFYVQFYIAGALEVGAADFEWTTGTIDPTPGDTPRGDASDSEIQLLGQTAAGNASGEGFAGSFRIDSQEVRPKLAGVGHLVITTGAGRTVYFSGSYIGGAGACTGVRITPSSGQVAAGSYVALIGRIA